MNFAEALRNKFTGPEGAARLQGVGLLLSQLGSGQTPNAGPALQMLEERKSQRALQEQMNSDDFMGRFTNEERAFLRSLPPRAAQQLIAQRIFAEPAAPRAGVEINGQLVDPVTGQVMGDYRDPEDPTLRETRVIGDRLVDAQSGEVIADYADDDGVTRYIASGDAAAALGLPADGAYNVESGPDGMTATAIGGGQTINIDNGGPEVGTIPQGWELHTDPETGALRMEPIPGGPEDNTEDDLSAADRAGSSIQLIDSIINDPALEGITGMIQGRMPPVSQAGTDLNVRIEQLKGQAFLSAFESLKGGGQITEREGAAATAAMARLDRAQSTPAYVEALSELRYIMDRARRRSLGEEVGAYDFAGFYAGNSGGQDGTLSDDDLLTKYGN